MATAYTPRPLKASPADFPVKYFIRDEEGKAAGVANTKEDGELWAAAPEMHDALCTFLSLPELPPSAFSTEGLYETYLSARRAGFYAAGKVHGRY